MTFKDKQNKNPKTHEVTHISGLFIPECYVTIWGKTTGKMYHTQVLNSETRGSYVVIDNRRYYKEDLK